MKKYIFIFTIIGITVILSACATTSDKQGAVSDEQRTKGEATLLGGMLGQLLGAAVGDDNRVKGAAIGGIIGAGAGYLVGSEIAKRKKKYASEEEFLDEEIVSAQELNEAAENYNARLRRDIQSLDRDTQTLSAQYDAGEITQAELDKERQAIKEKISDSDTILADLNKEKEIKMEVASEQRNKGDYGDTYAVQLEEEIYLLQKNIDELNRHSQQLASIDERLER